MWPLQRVAAGAAGSAKARTCAGERSTGNPLAKAWKPATRFLRKGLVRTLPTWIQDCAADFVSTRTLISGAITWPR